MLAAAGPPVRRPGAARGERIPDQGAGAAIIDVTNLSDLRLTPKASLLRLLARLRPRATEHPLIRLGAAADGGYLVPDDLDGITACFSPGVAAQAAFESDLIARGIPCFCADGSVAAPPIRHPLLDFERKYLGIGDDGPVMTLESWVDAKAPGQSEFILQMDIETSEYAVIFDTGSPALRKFRILVIEFHALHELFDRNGFLLMDLTFSKLLKDFDVVHIHPNNYARPVTHHGITVPPVLEFTFLRRDRIATRAPAHSFPHPLDAPNDPAREDVVLPACWYQEPPARPF